MMRTESDKVSMRAPNSFAAVVGTFWLMMIWAGLDGIFGVAAQHVAGYPNAGQIGFYVGIPLIVFLAILASAYVFNLIWRSRGAFTTVTMLALIFILAYLLPYGGGV